MCVCVCIRIVCVCLRMCVRACVCAVHECECLRSCVCACSLASQPYFNAYVHARAKVGRRREGKLRLSRPSSFCDSLVCVECVPRVHNDYLFMSFLESGKY